MTATRVVNLTPNHMRRLADLQALAVIDAYIADTLLDLELQAVNDSLQTARVTGSWPMSALDGSVPL